MTQNNYNMFSDFAIPILLIYILACCYFVKKLSIWCALKADLRRVNTVTMTLGRQAGMNSAKSKAHPMRLI
jgi:hypothetical protein